MSTRLKALASISAVAILSIQTAAFAARDNETFALPASGDRLQVPQANLTFTGKRFDMKAGKSKTSAPKVDTQKYLFEKQTFLTARRDQAIKLLRQELASGYKQNRDNVLLRLGQLYTEKYMELNFHEIELYNKLLKEQEEQEKKTGKKGKAPALNTKRSRKYLVLALDHLTRLEREYPRHPRLDEVLFFIGFVNMEMGNAKKGAQYLERLVNGYPKSRKYGEAVLYLADYYFDNQRFRDAAPKYRVLLRDKDSDLYYYALYKTAWCQLNLGDSATALKNMQTVVEKLEGSQEKLKFNLREQAVNDLATFYADSGQITQGFAYYKSVLGEEQAYEKMKLMAEAVHNRAQGDASIKAHTILLEKFRDDIEAPEYSMALYEANVRMSNYKEAVAVLKKTLEQYGESSSWANKHRSKNREKVEEKLKVLREDSTNAAYFFHRTAQKSKRKDFYEHGLVLYEAIPTAFPSHPDKRKLVFYQAEILFEQKRFLAAADRYMLVAKSPPKDKLAEEAAYNALLSVDQLTASSKVVRLTEKQKKEGNFEPQPIPKEEQRFIEVSEFYLAQFPDFKRANDVRFRIAGIYYRYFHFDKAAPIFEEIAAKDPKHKNAKTSAHLLLDIYNLRKDYAALGSAAGKFATDDKLGDEKFRTEMRSFQDQIGFKAIEKYESEKNWDKAGEAYYNYYRSNPNGKLAREALYNAVVTYEKTDNVQKQKETAELFMKKYPSHPYNTRLTLLQAKTAEESYDFERAQTLYEAFYRKHPKHSQSTRALYNAAVFAELLGKTGPALDLYAKYLATGKASAKERRAIQLSQAELYRKQGDWRRVAAIYTQLSDQAPTLADRIGLLGKLVDLYTVYGRRAERAAMLKKIASLTRNMASTKELGEDARFVSEARFSELADDKVAYERLRLRLPPTRLVQDMKRKQDALKKLDDAYEKVVALGEPEWGVAALAEKSSAYAQFVAAYRGIEIPKTYKGNERAELEKQMKQIDAELVAPFDAKAKELARLCVSKSVEFHIGGQYARSCQAQLSEGGLAVSPSGVLPQPAYWTTRWGNL